MSGTASGDATNDAVGDAAVVHRHVTGVFRFVRALGAPPEQAADLVQEAFAVAWQKQKQRLPARALGAFLRRTAKLLWLAQRRADRRAAAALAAAAERLWERDSAHDDGDGLAAAAAACVRRLRGRAARAVAMAYGDGLARERIANELGMRPGGVRTLLARTRAWLQRCIELGWWRDEGAAPRAPGDDREHGAHEENEDGAR